MSDNSPKSQLTQKPTHPSCDQPTQKDWSTHPSFWSTHPTFWTTHPSYKNKENTLETYFLF